MTDDEINTIFAGAEFGAGVEGGPDGPATPDTSASDDSSEGGRYLQHWWDRAKWGVLYEVAAGYDDPDTIVQTLVRCWFTDVPNDYSAEDRLTIAGELTESAIAYHAQWQKSWDARTDCDRLDELGQRLLEDGIVLWQGAPCCAECAWEDLDDVIEAARGKYNADELDFSFFHEGTLIPVVRDGLDGRRGRLMLNYGSYEAHRAMEDASDWTPDEDRESWTKLGVDVGRKIAIAADKVGLIALWDGDINRRIGLRVKWQKRRNRFGRSITPPGCVRPSP